MLTGGWLFLSGASNREPGEGKEDSGYFVGVSENSDGSFQYDVEAQTCRVIEALREALELVGHSLEDLVKVNCYLVDPADMAAFGRAYSKYFDASTGPVRTTVTVKALPHQHIRVEIEGIARERTPQSRMPTLGLMWAAVAAVGVFWCMKSGK